MQTPQDASQRRAARRTSSSPAARRRRAAYIQAATGGSGRAAAATSATAQRRPPPEPDRQPAADRGRGPGDAEGHRRRGPAHRSSSSSASTAPAPASSTASPSAAISDNPFGARQGGVDTRPWPRRQRRLGHHRRAAQRHGAGRRDAHAGRADPDGDLRREASFHVGGEFPFRTADETPRPAADRRRGRQSSDTRRRPRSNTKPQIDYGIGLDFTPGRALAGPHQPEDPHRGVGADLRERRSPFRKRSLRPATTLLGIRKRLAETTVELPSGGSLVIAGLVRDEIRQAISGYPGLIEDPDPRHAVPLAATSSATRPSS